ncbi:MAG: DegT/DnrJ/EryC1/StrS family aminotransferase [Chloroflexi bacterium]|nr:DegT/DnrJ/EryC1/StrS family aminotransferase [Chloroflexota bacterium]
MTERLAIQGGAPAVPTGLKVRWPMVTQDDKDAVLAALESGELGGPYAPQIVRLQDEWAAYCGAGHCLAFNSGTAALHAALVAVGVGPGDEVITSAFSFIASAMAILQAQAIPIFVDIDPCTFNLAPQAIEAKITPHTKAIMPVHIHGLPADMEAIGAIARRHGLAVVEDACQAHGATYRERKAGTLGDVGCFSLNRTKNLQCGEGGFFVTDRQDVFDRANSMRMFGEIIREGQERRYISYTVGWNYRSQELSAALGRSQLRRLDQVNAVAQRNGAYLSQALADVPGLEPPHVPADRTTVYHKYRITLQPERLGLRLPPAEFRDRVRAALEAEGVDAVLWQTIPLPAHPLFTEKIGFGGGYPWALRSDADAIQYRGADYPATTRLLDSSLVLCAEHHPIFCQPLELMEHYARAVRKVFANLEEIVE